MVAVERSKTGGFAECFTTPHGSMELANKKAPPGKPMGLGCAMMWLIAYQLRRRHAKASRPKAAIHSRAKVEGSGTAVAVERD